MNDNTHTASFSLVRGAFVARMESELQANQRKGDWRLWKPTPLQLLAEIQHHQGNLMLALSAGNRERITELAADLANYAMKCDELFGAKSKPQWISGPISCTCEVTSFNPTIECGAPTVAAYPAMGGGWMALCESHAKGHHPNTLVRIDGWLEKLTRGSET